MTSHPSHPVDPPLNRMQLHITDQIAAVCKCLLACYLLNYTHIRVATLCHCKGQSQTNPIYAPGHVARAHSKKGKGSPYSITERRVPELIPVLGSQPAGDVSHKPGGRLPLLSARLAVTHATLKRASTNFAAW